MRLIDVNINVIDGRCYVTVVRKYICWDGDLANYSKFTHIYDNLASALRFVNQMVLLLTDTDYHVTVNVVRVS